jgi:hypothetical protein
MSRSIAQALFGLLLVAGLAYTWSPLASWIEVAVGIDGGLAYSVAFLALVAVAFVAVRFVREQF